MDIKELLTELRTDVKALNVKLDQYNTQTVKNTTDITWLNRGMFGTIFTYFGAIIYSKFGS